MKLTPVVVLIDGPTLAKLREFTEEVHARTPDLLGLADVMRANGWSAEMILGGMLLRRTLEEKAA